MAYRKSTIKTRCSLEIAESFTARCRPSCMKREKRWKPTPEAMEKANQRRRERRNLILMRSNFEVGDCYQTHTWSPDCRPADMEEAKKQVGNFLKRVKRRYGKYGQDLKYMANIEVGSRGAWHIHIVVNEVRDGSGTGIASSILRDCWTYGNIKDTKRLREQGMFRDLSSYLIKNEKTDPEKCQMAKAMHSRNLVFPEEEVTTYTRRQVLDKRGDWKEIRIPEGYCLDQDSVYEGVNPYTGFPYRTYALLKLPAGRTKGG